MKKKNTTLTLMLATALVSGALGGAFLVSNQVAAETTTPTAATQSIDSVFEKSAGVEFAPQTMGEGTTATNVAAYKLTNGDSVKLKRNLALKWYEGKDDPAYATVKFSFNNEDFTKITLSMDTASAWATVEGKTTNVIEFVKSVDGTLTAYVNPTWGEDGSLTNGAKGQVITNKTGELTLQLKATDVDGEFLVAVTENGATADFDKLNAFTNIGANYAKYLAKNDYPLSFTATTPADKTATVCIYEINGQKFTGITEVDGVYKVSDSAAPVLVVNETFDGFLIGTKFTLNESDDDYKVIDVLQDSNLTTKVKAYQYKPALGEGQTIETGKEKEAYFDLKTSTTFYETSYKKGAEGSGDWTTVYSETGGEEYLSIFFELSDDTYNQTTGTNQKATYFLSWYATESAAEVKPEVVLNETLKTAPAGGEWIYLNRKESAPYYKLPGENATQEEIDAFNTAKTNFLAALQKQASTKYAGSNEDLQIPSVKWLMDDNNGYRAMQFTISYYTPTSTTGSPASLTSKDFDELEIPVEAEGWYEFKIFASDATGNKMQHTLEDEDEPVDITVSNVWDMEDIPSFAFEIKDQGLKVEEPAASKLKSTEILDKTYKLSSSDMKVVGATNLKKAYKLYRIDGTKFNGFQSSALTKIKYEDLAAKLKSNIDNGKINKENAHAEYLKAYAELMVEQLGLETADVENVLKCFIPVSEQGDTINDSKGDFEKFEWNPTAVSFKTAEEGEYLILADFWEGDRPESRAAAYKIVVVESKGYQVQGEDNWFEDNIVSVILFAIAGVMLILIVILLMVKPSDETLEDVEAKAAKKAKKSKKAKKEKTEPKDNE